MAGALRSPRTVTAWCHQPRAHLSLQVGGIKDKVLAAHRAGLKCIVIPQRNEKDLEEIPGHVRQDLSFVRAGRLDDVLNAAFDGGFPVQARPGTLDSKL